MGKGKKLKWIAFNQSMFANQKLPPERHKVLVQIAARELDGTGMPPAVAVGYLRFAAGDKKSPFFVIPGVGGEAVAWSDCLPENFAAPLWKMPDAN